MNVFVSLFSTVIIYFVGLILFGGLYILITIIFTKFDENLVDINSDMTWSNDWKYLSIPLDKKRTYIYGDEHLNVLERKSKKCDDENPLLILLHGFPESALITWGETIPFINERFHIIAPDQRGYNHSYSPPEVKNYHSDFLVDDIVDIIRYFNPEGNRKVYIVGHDYGAIVTWKLSLDYEKLIDGLIIVNVPHPEVLKKNLRSLEQLRKSWYMFYFQIPYLPEFLSRFRKCSNFLGFVVNSSNPKSFKTYHVEMFRQLWNRSLTTMIHWYRASFRYQLLFPSSEKGRREKVFVTKNKVMVIWGEKDIFLRKEMAKESVELCQDGKLVSLNDTTHWVSHEKPELLATYINEFFV